MTTRGRPRRLRWRLLDLTGSLLLAALVATLAIAGTGALPGVGAAFNPGTGVWRLSNQAITPTPGTFHLPGLHQPATVAFESNGLAHITTGDDNDLFQVIGYVQAHFRLVQMDLIRRQASGTLSEILGPAAVDSDEFELDLGLRRAAQRDWDRMPNGDAKTALIAYSAGVNAAIDQLTRDGGLPTAFKLLGYRPAPWTPVDSLLVQRLVTQTLSFSDAALTFSYAADALPTTVFNTWFPTVPANAQQPFDPGPYQKEPLSPAPVRADAAVAPIPAGTPAPDPSPTALGHADGLGSLLARLDALPNGEIHQFGASNAWAVSGAHTTSGQALFAADPHLDMTLPAIWYQLEGTSPGYHFAGPTIPGLPVPLMGRTASFSWGVTDAQHPTTLYYLEKTDSAHPDQYYWDGSWRAMQDIPYTIAVKGGPAKHYVVRLTVHGPILQMQHQTASVWWAGALPSQNIDAVLKALRAHTFAEFRESMRGWITPSVDFVYADDAGHIGAFNVGVAPQVTGHNIDLPLAGDGSADVAGSIPYDQLPHVYDPPSGYVVSANQREIGPDYPYEFSSSYNFIDQGWRATEIADRLDTGQKLDAIDFQHLQTDQGDQLAATLTPLLRSALAGIPLSGVEQQVATALSSWNDAMSSDSAAATFFEAFQEHLVYLVFEPWWNKYNIPDDPENVVTLAPYGGSAGADIFGPTLVNWIEHDPTNPYLTPPGAAPRTPTALIRQSFTDTVRQLTGTYGTDLTTWDYGRHHFLLFQSLLQVSPLNAGPLHWGGDGRTVNSAVGTLYKDGKAVTDTVTGGPSWRFVMDWGTGTGASIYPGGQSENPLSPWYDNGLEPWIRGDLWPMTFGTPPSTSTIWKVER